MGASRHLPDGGATVGVAAASSDADAGPEGGTRQRWWGAFSYVARRLEALLGDFVADAGVGAGHKVVDYGCGEQPYRWLFPGCEYIPVDLPSNPTASVHIDPNGKVPLPDDSADLVISTQVLEHVTDPETYLNECHRMLRPGGQLVLTTHGVMFLHRHPTDFWRWTCDGLRLILERAGFTVADQRGVMTLTAAGLQLVQQDRLAKARSATHKRLIGAFFQALIVFSDRRGTEEDRRENGFVLGVRAIKPMSPGGISPPGFSQADAEARHP
jgi:SAM-dependent methyltransferase